MISSTPARSDGVENFLKSANAGTIGTGSRQSPAVPGVNPATRHVLKQISSLIVYAASVRAHQSFFISTIAMKRAEIGAGCRLADSAQSALVGSDSTRAD